MEYSELIKLYFNRGGLKYESRKEAEKMYKEMAVHASKAQPTEILKRKRPNEQNHHLEYRLAVHEPITYGWFNKVMLQFAKIRRAEDWNLRYNKQDGNGLYAYCEENFPHFDTVTNWLFSYQLRRIISDPNGIILFMPRNIFELLDKGITDRAKQFEPIPFYFPTPTIVVNRPDVVAVEVPRANLKTGLTDKYLLVADANNITLSIANKEGEITTKVYNHDLGELTVLTNGGVIDKEYEGETPLYESFIAPAIPFWNEAIESESDHKVDKALHLHPDRYEYQSGKCRAKGCNKGSVTKAPGQIEPCGTCHGTGRITPRSPFGTMYVNMEKVNGSDVAAPPMPPAGYILRPIASIELTKKLADAKIYDGLAALNLELIGQTLQNQSGAAKSYDRQEIDAYITLVATHLVENILRPTYYYINLWLNPDKDANARLELEPKVNVPRKFDLITAEIWQQRVATYQTSNANASVMARAEIKAAGKQFGEDSPEFMFIRDCINLDPLYGMSAESKADAILNAGCSQVDYIISTKIAYFVRRAAIESEDKFFELPYAEKVALLEKYADETRAKGQLQTTGFLDPALTGGMAAGGAETTDLRATLRNSVGGSTIVGEVRKQVATGMATYEAGINQLVIQLGYTDQEARAMLGNPLDLKKEVKEGEITA